MSFEQLSDDLRSLDSKVDNLTTQVAAYAPAVRRTEREVFGNGRPSLATQMAEVKTTQRLALKVLGTIGVAGVGLLATIAIKIVFYGL